MTEINLDSIEDMITDDLYLVWKLVKKGDKKNTYPIHSHTNILVRERGCTDQLYHLDHFDGYIAIWPLWPFLENENSVYDITVIKVRKLYIYHSLYYLLFKFN